MCRLFECNIINCERTTRCVSAPNFYPRSAVCALRVRAAAGARTSSVLALAVLVAINSIMSNARTIAAASHHFATGTDKTAGTSETGFRQLRRGMRRVNVENSRWDRPACLEGQTQEQVISWGFAVIDCCREATSAIVRQRNSGEAGRRGRCDDREERAESAAHFRALSCSLTLRYRDEA